MDVIFEKNQIRLVDAGDVYLLQEGTSAGDEWFTRFVLQADDMLPQGYCVLACEDTYLHPENQRQSTEEHLRVLGGLLLRALGAEG